MNLLIVYYSREGSTRQIARGLALSTGGTLRELMDSHKTENGGMFHALFATVFGLGTTLVKPDYTIEPYDALVVMTPVWIGNPVPAVTTFVGNIVLKGKKTFVIAVGGTGANLRAIARLEKRLKTRGAFIVGHTEVLGYIPDPKAVRPSDEELVAEGVQLAEVVRQAFGVQLAGTPE